MHNPKLPNIRTVLLPTVYMDDLTDAILEDCGHQLLECRGCIAITHLHYLASKRAKYCSECCLMDVF